MKSTINSSESLVAYLDLLGYKNAVYTESNALKYCDAIDADIYRWGQVLGNHQFNYGKIVKNNISLQVISDTFVIVLDQQKALSELDDNSSASKNIILMIFLNLISYLVQDCIRSTKLLIRGSVVKGQYFYKTFNNLEGGSFVFSKAFCKASELEKDIAVMPRILIDNSVLDGVNIDVLLLKKYRPDNVLLCNEDGCYCLNIYASLFSQDYIVSVLKEIVPIIKDGIKNSENIKVVQKYIWFANYHNKLVEAIFESNAATSWFKEFKDNYKLMLIEIPRLQ